MNFKNTKIFEINTYKIIILVFLYLASYCALQVEDAGLCVMSFYEEGVLTHFHEIQGSEIDDGAVFGAAGLLSLIFSPLYFFRLSRPWFIGLLTTLCLLQFFCLSMVVIPLNLIIHDSIKYCDNVWLLECLICQLIFMILNLIYINISAYWE